MELSSLFMFSLPKSKEASGFVLQVNGVMGFALEEFVFTHTSFPHKKKYDMPPDICSLALRRTESKELVFRDYQAAELLLIEKITFLPRFISKVSHAYLN